MLNYNDALQLHSILYFYKYFFKISQVMLTSIVKCISNDKRPKLCKSEKRQHNVITLLQNQSNLKLKRNGVAI